MLKSQDFAPNIKDVISTMNILCGTLTIALNLYLIVLCIYLIQNGTTDTYRLPLAVDYTLPSDLPTYNLNDLPSECNNNLVVDDGYYVCTYSIPSKQKEHLNGVIAMLAFQYILGYALRLESFNSVVKLQKYYLFCKSYVRRLGSVAIDTLYDLGYYLAKAKYVVYGYIIQRRVYAHLCLMLVLIVLQYL